MIFPRIRSSLLQWKRPLGAKSNGWEHKPLKELESYQEATNREVARVRRALRRPQNHHNSEARNRLTDRLQVLSQTHAAIQIAIERHRGGQNHEALARNCPNFLSFHS